MDGWLVSAEDQPGNSPPPPPTHPTPTPHPPTPPTHTHTPTTTPPPHHPHHHPPHPPTLPTPPAECPGTGTLFSLKDGSIVSWYPSNPVLRMLTPKDTCRTLEIYPVHLGESAISVNVSGACVRASVGRGWRETG